MKNCKLPSTLVPSTPNAPRRRRPAPSRQAMEAAASIQSYPWGIKDQVFLASMIDYSTRCPELDAVAIAAAKLLAALPLAACRKQRGRRTRLSACRRPALKLAHALKSLAAEDLSLASGTMRSVKGLTSNSFTA